MARPLFRNRFVAGQPQGILSGLQLPPIFPLPGLNRFTDVLSKAVNANLQFHQTMGQLTLQFLQASTQASMSLMQQLAGVLTDLPAFGGAGAPGRASLFLEGVVGDKPSARFLVENTLAQSISSKIVATPFRDHAGKEIHPHLEFDPATVNLNPAEQAVVTVTASIVKEMALGVDYSGELEVEGMPGRITMVIRRRAPAAA